MRIWTIAVIILLIMSYIVIAVNNLDLSKSEDRNTFLGRLWLWVKGLGKNTSDVVGYAAQKDWLPRNESNSTARRQF